MPLINADFKALEWLCIVHMSEDKIGTKELLEGVDIHEVNRVAFNLPDRLTAKKFVFRLIYGGSPYSYAMDPDFRHVSTKSEYWEKVINKFYMKYKGIAHKHQMWITEAMMRGRVTTPTGRSFKFVPDPLKRKWPRTTILNYPVQSFGADLMTLARIAVHERVKYFQRDWNYLVKEVSTVHDSIVLDAPSHEVAKMVTEVKEAWKEIPRRFSASYGGELLLPCKVEVSTGPNLGQMTEV